MVRHPSIWLYHCIWRILEHMGLPSRQSHVGMLWKCEFMDAQQSCEQPWWLIWKNHIRNKISINSKQKHLKCFQKKHLMFSKKHWTFLKKHLMFSKIPRDVFLKNNGMFFRHLLSLFWYAQLTFSMERSAVKTVFKQCFNSVLMPFKHGVIITEKLRFPIVSFPLQAPQSP